MYNPFREQTGDDNGDIEHIGNALKGDGKSLEALILRHQSWIYNISLSMTGNMHRAEDITQDVLIKVITKLSTYDAQRASFRTWLYRIVVNHVLTM